MGKLRIFQIVSGEQDSDTAKLRKAICNGAVKRFVNFSEKNFLFDNAGKCKIIRFGIAKFVVNFPQILLSF